MDAALMQITGADQHQADINEAITFEACVSLVRKYHRTAQARVRDFVEAFFWLGAAVARARRYASWGDNYISQLRKETSIGANTLRRAQGFYEVFAGDFGEMYEWVGTWIERHDQLLMRDVASLVSLNKERRKAAREQDDGSDGSDTPLPELNNPVRHTSERDRLTPQARRRLRLFKRVRQGIERMVQDDLAYLDVPDAILPDGRVVSVEILVHYTEKRYDEPRWRYAHAVLTEPGAVAALLDDWELQSLLEAGPPSSAVDLYRCVLALESAIDNGETGKGTSGVAYTLKRYFKARTWPWPQSADEWMRRAEESSPVERLQLEGVADGAEG